MHMFLEFDEHAQFLEDMVDEKPEQVIIASYGLYAGITYKGHDTTEWGEKYQLRTRSLLEAMRDISEVLILIGAPNYNSCKGKKKCTHCEMQYARQILRIVSHAELFPEFKWKMTQELHLKCSLFDFGETHRGIAGGRNFTDSNWADITFELTEHQITTLRSHTMNLWEQAMPATDESAQMILNKEGISEQSMIALLNTTK